MDSQHSLISCICITHNRIALLKRAINCFKAQNYPNKELVISYPQNDKLTKHIVEQLIIQGSVNIIKVERAYTASLGAARNQAILQANGEYICTWDDDDWYHESRLTLQLHYIKDSNVKFMASILSHILLYDQTVKKAYISFLYPWENTLMCKKEYFFENKYYDVNRGEDSNIIDFLDSNKILYHILEMPYIYIYIYISYG